MLKPISKWLAAGVLCLTFMRASVLFDSAQPVQWEFKYITEGKDIVLVINAMIDKGWHIYSMNESGDGPIPTELVLEKSDDYKILGKAEEESPIKKYDPGFDAELSYFEGSVEFRQKIKPLTKDFYLKGSITAMACDNQKCLPPFSQTFSLHVEL